MTYTRRRNAGVVVMLLLVAAVLCGFASPGIRGGIAATVDSATTEAFCTYYNNRANADGNDGNNFWFDGEDENGNNTYQAAEKAVKDGEATDILTYLYTNDGKLGGEYIRRINPHDGSTDWDPALLAAHCTHVENVTGVTILTDEQDEPIARRPDAAHLHFLKDREYAEACYDKLVEMYKKASVGVQEINSYTSAMYMWNNGLEGNKPAVIVRNTENAGGHMLVFNFGDKVGVVKYRIECGFQPIDITYIPTPDVPPVPDNPEPTPPSPTPDPPGGSDPEPTPTPTLKPKDPNAGPQGQHPDNPDYGGGPNTNNDETVTDDPHPERNSPDAYVAPDPPKPETPSGGGDAPTEKPDASSGTRSGSQTVDHNNGRQETYTDPDTGAQGTGTVQAGDGRDHGDFAQQVDDHPATVEQHADPAPTTDEPSPGNDEFEAPE